MVMAGGAMVYSRALAARIARHAGEAFKFNTAAITRMISRGAASQWDSARIQTQRVIREAVERRLPFDIRLDCRLPDVVLLESVRAPVPSFVCLLVYSL